MIQINMKADIAAAKRKLSLIQRKHVPFATALALTRTAQAAKEEVRKTMTQVFHNPINYTLNALMMTPARKDRLHARVWVKNKLDAGKGTSPEDYLLPQIEGGTRNLKRFEVALQKRGILPSGMYAVPGAGARMDAYGNMSRGQIVEILSYLQAFGEQGYKANMTAKRMAGLRKGSKTRRGYEYFVVRPGTGNHLPPGVWQRVSFGMGKAIKPVLIFVRAPVYQKRLPFTQIVERVARRELKTQFDKALAYALATAR